MPKRTICSHEKSASIICHNFYSMPAWKSGCNPIRTLTEGTKDDSFMYKWQASSSPLHLIVHMCNPIENLCRAHVVVTKTQDFFIITNGQKSARGYQAILLLLYNTNQHFRKKVQKIEWKCDFRWLTITMPFKRTHTYTHMRIQWEQHIWMDEAPKCFLHHHILIFLSFCVLFHIYT